VGLSIDDFASLTPAELKAVMDAWTYDYRERWERARRVAAFSILPYCRKGTRIGTLFPLPWDAEFKGDDSRAMTREERLKRAGEVLRLWRNGTVKGD
jgi:hypothetical protein